MNLANYRDEGVFMILKLGHDHQKYILRMKHSFRIRLEAYILTFLSARKFRSYRIITMKVAGIKKQ